jgi:hypothetical protein
MQAAVLAATRRPLSTVVHLQLSGSPAWAAIPSWALVGTAGHVVAPAAQLAMAQHAQAHIVKVDPSQLSMTSHPAAVTRLIVAAARSTS